jgi:hypothetical protein
MVSRGSDTKKNQIAYKYRAGIAFAPTGNPYAFPSDPAFHRIFFPGEFTS